MGMYDYTQINIDVNKLYSLGFNQQEVANLQYIYSNGGKFTPQALQSYGYTYEQSKRLVYMYNICCGKIQIESQDQFVKHLKKTFGGYHRITMQDLEISKVTNVPRVAVVANINVEPYTIWNSKNYSGKEALYKVIDVTGQNITVETSRKPRIEYGTQKSINNMLEIKGIRANGNCVIQFNKNYCKLCNRFIIVASLKNPEFTLGKITIICDEGTKVYVYAINMGIKENVHYNNGTQRIYDFGIFPQDIQPKLKNVAKILYNKLNGVSVNFEDANQDYQVVEVKRKLSESDMIDN